VTPRRIVRTIRDMTAKTLPVLVSLISLVSLYGCSGGSPDYQGTYASLATPDTTNAAGIPGWPGPTAATIVITQDPTDLAYTQVDFGGALGNYMDMILGNHVATGYTRGNGFMGDIYGNPIINGACTSSLHASITISVDADALTGNIELLPECAGGSPNDIALSGTRPTTK
jgi:hypothetical protein